MKGVIATINVMLFVMWDLSANQGAYTHGAADFGHHLLSAVWHLIA